MKKYQYYLLDWDGNLARTLHIWLVAIKEILRQHGFDKTDREVADTFGSFTRHAREWGIEDPEAVFLEAEELVKDEIPNVELYPDALEVLEKLHASGKRLALITTSPHRNVDHLLEKYDMRRFFDVVIAGDDVEHFKPHTEPLEKAMAVLKGYKEKTVMIGDTDKDVGAAKNFGVDSILFFPDEHKVFYDFEELKALEPTYIVEDFKDILKTI